MRSAFVAVLVLAMACDKQVASAPSPTPAPAPTPQSPKAPDKSKMSEFKHRAVVHAHAAKLLKVAVDQVEGGPIDEAMAKVHPHTAGKVWGTTVWLKPDNHSREARAWVTEDGKIVDGDTNLGLLLAELGLWTKPEADHDAVADAIAAKLTWSYGMNHAVIDIREGAVAPPEITLKPDGSGTVVFFTSYRTPGPGGAGGGPKTVTRNEIVVTAKHDAKLTKTPVK
jgi:hypothetical protein